MNYTLQDLQDAVKILCLSPFWERYTVEVKRIMAPELANLLHCAA
jgi:hypothetical protein